MIYNGFSCVFGCFCKCFKHMFQMFHLLQAYVASVASGCFKSRSDVAHVAMAPYHRVSAPTWHGAPRALLSTPSPSFPSLHLASALVFELGSSSLLRSDADAGVGWDAEREGCGMGCDVGARGRGIPCGRRCRSIIRTSPAVGRPGDSPSAC
jgi:hypothetical protein